MELGISAKRKYFAYSLNQSLLELAVKLRQAEVRVNGRTLQTAVPPRSVLDGISSTVDGGRFQFISRRYHVSDNAKTLECSNGNDAAVTTHSVPEVVATNGFCADDEPVSVTTHSKKLSLPDRCGPSLWPFLSSIKPSVDAEHVRFLEKNQKFYSNYEMSSIAEDYIEPLSKGDFEIIIGSAIDTVLQTRESNVSRQSRPSKTEPAVSAAVSAAPLPVNTEVDAPSTFETDNISTVPSQPAVVSKRYAAAVANPRRFRCGLCPYSTNNRSHVRRHHISVHSDARPYRCYVCGKEFARCENAKVHMISRHPDVPYDIDRLRNNLFFKINNDVPPTEMDSAPTASTQSSSVSALQTAFQLQQDIASCGIPPQWPSDSLEAELQRARLERHQVIAPWLNFPKIEPKVDPSLPVFGHGNTGNQLFEGIPRGLFQSQANTVLNVPSMLGSVTPVKQELPDIKPVVYPLSDRHICFYCQFVCQTAAELASHIAASHSALTPASHVTPNSNPGYVVLQTAAPIFLFPYGSEPVLPNRNPVGLSNLGYQPILPKLPAVLDECNNQNEASAEQQSTSAVAVTTGRSPENVPNAKAASACCSAATGISQPPSTPASSEAKRERKRQFKTFYCSRCPDRAPFRYEKSFEKHLKQHRFEDRSRRSQKIASKVA